ncbi:hypothetical protein OA107_04320 [Candidatus Pelagibacter sp.]|nr:hypothetical protein [Candidatus Pelagibacter sp.]
MKILKITLINFIIFLFLILIIEIIFGSWVKKNNFGTSIRELRNVEMPMSVKYDGKQYDYVFKRNNLGFIGDNLDPSKIQIVFLGGSTGEEMFKPPDYTIVGQLNSKLAKDGIDLKIINASKGGKTTRGYVNDFNHWFSKINNFNPKKFIFYIGINDSSLTMQGLFDKPYKNSLSEKIEDYIKNNSIIYLLKKKIENKYFNELRKHYGLVKENLYSNFQLINYNKAREKFLKSELSDIEKNIIENFSKNLQNLNKIIIEEKIDPIFITQIQFNGINNKKLFIINEYLKEFCKINNFNIIKLDEMSYDLNDKDFYDEVHTTIEGSRKISSLIYKDIKKYLTE